MHVCMYVHTYVYSTCKYHTSVLLEEGVDFTSHGSRLVQRERHSAEQRLVPLKHVVLEVHQGQLPLRHQLHVVGGELGQAAAQVEVPHVQVGLVGVRSQRSLQLAEP